MSVRELGSILGEVRSSKAAPPTFSYMGLASSSFVHDPTPPMGPTSFDPSTNDQKIYRFIVGLDSQMPKEMTEEDTGRYLNDPFADVLLKQGRFPETTKGVIQEFEEMRQHPRGIEEIHAFVVAEGGQIHWNEKTKEIDRTARFVFSMQSKGGIGPDVLISTGTTFDSGRQFLQLMSWDPKNGAYNFYQRLRGLWVWSGNSFMALDPSTRGKGPFSGHTNGGPLMKELRLPWQNWHSGSAIINSSAFSPDDPLIANPYFQKKEKGDILEGIVRSGISHWNQSRIGTLLSSDPVPVNHLMRQILQTTNVNLRSSGTRSEIVKPTSKIILPFTFFVNFDAFSALGVEIPVNPITVEGSIYLQSLKDFDVRLESDGQRIESDTHFAFLVPEFAFEDSDLLQKMIDSQITTPHFIASLLMVDFSNPLYSPRRAGLFQYIPQNVPKGGTSKMEEAFLEAIQRTGRHLDPNTPEGEFFSYWNVGADQSAAAFKEKVSSYFEKLQQACGTQEGYNQIVRLAESRRFQFKKTAQFEFDLTFAETNIPPSSFPLRITADGVVVSDS